MTLIAIGVDQSTTKTGLCMRRFTLNGHSKVIRAATINTPTYIDMRNAITGFIALHSPTVIMCEDGFKGCNVMTTVTAAWVEAIVCQYKLGEMFDKVSASEWRKAVWGKMKSLNSAEWKAYSIAQAIKAGIVDPDDHQGDADGICQYAIKMYTEGSR